MTWASGDGPATGELAEAALVLRLGWTYREYQDAPDWLIDDMLLLLNAEAEHIKGKGLG